MTVSFKWLAGAVIMAGLFGGCDSKDNTAQTNSTGATTAPSATTMPSAAMTGTDKPLRLAFVTNNASDYWTTARGGCEQGAKENTNVTVDFKIPSEQTAAEQKRIIDDLLARGCEGIAISPSDPTNETPMLNDVAHQTLLITQDSDAPQSDRAFYIGTNNHDAGKQAGELIKKALPDGGKIMIFVGTKDAQNAQDRLSGIQEVLAGTKIETIDVRTDDAKPDRAKANVQDTLAKYPDISALVGLYSYNGPAISTVVNEAGKKGSVKVVCFDFDPGVLESVKDGTIFGTVVQQPYEFGRQAVAYMTKYLRGDKSFVPPNKQIIVPSLAITSDNVDDFMNKIKSAGGK